MQQTNKQTNTKGKRRLLRARVGVMLAGVFVWIFLPKNHVWGKLFLVRMGPAARRSPMIMKLLSLSDDMSDKQQS